MVDIMDTPDLQISTFNNNISIALNLKKLFKTLYRMVKLKNKILKRFTTVEPRFNEPLVNEVLDVTNDILRTGQIYSKINWRIAVQLNL